MTTRAADPRVADEPCVVFYRSREDETLAFSRLAFPPPPTRHPSITSMAHVDLPSLLREFYAVPQVLATFKRSGKLPEPFGELLNHHAHMTVTVERYHQSPVDVVIHRCRGKDHDGNPMIQLLSKPIESWIDQLETYTREITLVTRMPDTNALATVQYGIVRLNVASLDPMVWRTIAHGQTPLGRVLVENEVLREVELSALWKVTTGKSLSRYFGLPIGSMTYGRTAWIHLDGRPAIELLEIVNVENKGIK